MRMSVDTGMLQEVVSAIGEDVGGSGSSVEDAAACVLLVRNAQGLRLEMGNQQVRSIRHLALDEPGLDGAAAVRQRTLRDVLRAAGNDMVRLEAIEENAREGTWMQIDAGRCRWRMRAKKMEEYRQGCDSEVNDILGDLDANGEVMADDGAWVLRMNCQKLREAMGEMIRVVQDRAWGASPGKETRTVIRMHETGTDIVATNRAVLSLVRTSECEDNGRRHDVLIPEAGVRGLVKALENRTGPVQLIASARGYIVELPGGDRWGGVTETEAFPEYERVVRDPSSFSTQVRSKAQRMADGVRAASLARNAMVEVTAERGHLTLKGIDTESGEIERTIEVESEVVGEPMPERESRPAGVGAVQGAPDTAGKPEGRRE